MLVRLSIGVAGVAMEVGIVACMMMGVLLDGRLACLGVYLGKDLCIHLFDST